MFDGTKWESLLDMTEEEGGAALRLAKEFILQVNKIFKCRECSAGMAELKWTSSLA